MGEKKKKALAWIKTHKKQLIISGISVAAVICIVLSIKNKNALIEFLASIEKSTKKSSHSIPSINPSADNDITALEITVPRTYTAPNHTVDVPQHIRKLPEGRHHSAKKAEQAAKLGIFLLSNETIVDHYCKNCAAA
ncbi:MAG: hypothetical protein IKL05_01520 [Clostridia bacterium]|nr:hypothetical protein [Clostridia bacterium]